MIKIEKIKIKGDNLFIKYITFDADNQKTEEYNVRSNRTPEPEFYAAWEAVQGKLPELLAADKEKCTLTLRQLTFKRKNSFSDQLDYKVKFHGHNNVAECIEQDFNTLLKKCYEDESDEETPVDVESLTASEKLWKEMTENVNSLIECTVGYINGASAQKNLFPANDALAGAGVEEEY
jgi:hypothetical protein